MEPVLHLTRSPGAAVDKLPDGTWHLEVPASMKAGYRLAQLDDPGSQRRFNFLWRPPVKFSLQARVSAENIPGTWGFGLWNDPFSFFMANVGRLPRLPTLPDAAWFFHASPENHLSFSDDLPPCGFLAATFQSKKQHTACLLFAAPFTLIPTATRVARRLIRRIIHQDAALIKTSVTEWHAYSLEWTAHQVSFSLDGVTRLKTSVSPEGPLCIVVWIDNQYAALPPGGRLRYGTLPNPEAAWMEIRDFSIQSDSSKTDSDTMEAVNRGKFAEGNILSK